MAIDKEKATVESGTGAAGAARSTWDLRSVEVVGRSEVCD